MTLHAEKNSLEDALQRLCIAVRGCVDQDGKKVLLSLPMVRQASQESVVLLEYDIAKIEAITLAAMGELAGHEILAPLRDT